MLIDKSLSGALKIEWEIIGTLTLDGNGKLKFPNAPAKGRLYQFNVEKTLGGASRYVGETDNLKRRFWALPQSRSDAANEFAY